MEGFMITCVLVVLIWMLYKYRKQGDCVENNIPELRGIPLFACALQLASDRFLDMFSDIALKLGDIFQIRNPLSTLVLLNSIDLVQKAFQDEKYKHVFNNRPSFFTTEYVYNGGQTISLYKTTDDNVHSELRKALAQSMHVYGEGIPKFEKNMNVELRRVIAELESLQGDEVDVTSVLNASLANVISIMLIGQPADETDRDNLLGFVWHQDYFMGPVPDYALSTFPFLRFIPGCYKSKYDLYLGFKQRIIEKYFIQTKATRQPGTIRGMVDWYLDYQQDEIENGREPFMTDVKISLNVLEVIVAGLNSSQSVLSSTMLCLLNHPEYQTKIQEEIDAEIGNQRAPSSRDKHSCPFTEAVLMETHRYLTPIPLLAPHETATDVVFEGYTVKQKTVVLANAWFIHHDEKIWGDPWTFRPERFLDEKGDIVPNTHLCRKSWVPFGVGRRRCPGESLARSRLFLYLSTLLQRFTFIPSETGCPTSDFRKGQFEQIPSVRPKPFTCRVIKRGVNTNEEL